MPLFFCPNFCFNNLTRAVAHQRRVNISGYSIVVVRKAGGESKQFYFHGNFRKFVIFVELSVTGRSIVVVRKAGGLVVRVRFSTPRQLLNSPEDVVRSSTRGRTGIPLTPTIIKFPRRCRSVLRQRADRDSRRPDNDEGHSLERVVCIDHHKQGDF